MCLAAVVLAEVLGAEEDALAHDFTGLEFHGGAGRNNDIFFRFVGIATDTRLGEANFKNPEIAQFDGLAVREAIGDVFESFLDDGESFLLGDSNLFADFDDHVALGEIWHKMDINGSNKRRLKEVQVENKKRRPNFCLLDCIFASLSDRFGRS